MEVVEHFPAAGFGTPRLIKNALLGARNQDSLILSLERELHPSSKDQIFFLK